MVELLGARSLGLLAPKAFLPTPPPPSAAAPTSQNSLNPCPKIQQRPPPVVTHLVTRQPAAPPMPEDKPTRTAGASRPRGPEAARQPIARTRTHANHAGDRKAVDDS